MNAVRFVLFTVLALHLNTALADSAKPKAASQSQKVVKNYDKKTLDQWFYSHYNRGKDYPSQLFPISNGDTQRVMICSGAGCPIRLKFTFTSAHKVAAQKAFATACKGKSQSECELEGLRAAVQSMEIAVWKELLLKVGSDTIQKAFERNSQTTLTSHPGLNQQLTLDCVDQANNGVSYLVVLSNWGMMKNHKIPVPGLEHLGLQPHFYTRIQDLKGNYMKFDLYDRSNGSSKRRLPYVAREPGNRSFN